MADGGISARGGIRIILAVAGGLVALIVLAFVIGFLPRSTTRITSVADRVAVPAGWVLTQEQVEPPRFICLGDNPCPSLSRTWATGADLSEQEFTAFVTATGWRLAVDRTCELSPSTFGEQTACTATGTVGQYVAKIILSGTVGDPASANVQLMLRPSS
jgi:hypothetical protein